MLSIALGFVLTVLIGGAWASYLQRRSWEHQRTSRLAEEDRQYADEVCSELSTQVDKCLYRMRLFLRASKANSGVSADKINQLADDYDEAIRDWNDKLNTRVATVGTHFGLDLLKNIKTLSEQIDTTDRLINDLRARDGDPDKLLEHVKKISENAYTVTGRMMIRIRQGRVGRDALNPMKSSDLQGAK